MSSYHRMSIAEKRAVSLASVRESPESCPNGCGTTLMPADMLTHLDQRCTGPRAPGPGAKWITWREAKRIVPERTLVRWIERGAIRYQGGRGDRKYLYRDLAVRVSQLRGFRRR